MVEITGDCRSFYSPPSVNRAVDDDLLDHRYEVDEKRSNAMLSRRY